MISDTPSERVTPEPIAVDSKVETPPEGTEMLTHKDLAKRLGYPVPPKTNPQPTKDQAKPILDFAQSLGQQWEFQSGNRKFYRVG